MDENKNEGTPAAEMHEAQRSWLAALAHDASQVGLKALGPALGGAAVYEYKKIRDKHSREPDDKNPGDGGEPAPKVEPPA